MGPFSIYDIQVLYMLTFLQDIILQTLDMQLHETVQSLSQIFGTAACTDLVDRVLGVRQVH